MDEFHVVKRICAFCGGPLIDGVLRHTERCPQSIQMRAENCEHSFEPTMELRVVVHWLPFDPSGSRIQQRYHCPKCGLKQWKWIEQVTTYQIQGEMDNA